MFKLEEGWLTVLLLLALIGISAGGVAACQWADGLWTAAYVGMLGLLAGLALAKSRFAEPVTALLATVYGLFCVGLFIGFILPGDWHARSVAFILRMGAFFLKLIFGGTSRDALPFPVLVDSLFWLMGVNGAWAIFRRQSVWTALLPPGLMLVINAYYYQGSVNLNLYLTLYAGLALVFLAHQSLLTREREWRAARVAFSPELRGEFLRAALVVVGLSLGLAWLAPKITPPADVNTFWQQTTGSWSLVRENWIRLFNALRGTGQAANDFYGDSLALGGAPRLGDTPIMDVALAPLRPEANGRPLAPPRYYWRAAAYEHYSGGQWQLGDSAFKEFDSLSLAPQLPVYRQRREISVLFTIRTPSLNWLYVLPQPRQVSLSNNTPAIFYTTLENELPTDITVVRARDVLAGNARTYRVFGSVSVADVDSLRQAGMQYPAWVLTRFLQLPPEITARTRQLAQAIVDNAGARNPFDQAQAVTDWLRANITYDLNLQAPPAEAEPVDWLLFEARRGYCNYYASAEVVLLRSLGLPARLAAGFAEGDYEESTSATAAAIYHVKENNAHAWVEVFFPDYGWVEFEPTASEAPLTRPQRPAATSGSATPPPEQEPTQAPPPTATPPSKDALPLPVAAIDWGALGRGGALALGIAGALSLLMLGLLVWRGLLGWESLGVFGRWIMRARRQPLPSAIGALYLRLERATRWLGLTLPATLTPHERAEALAQAAPEARPGVEALTAEYVREQYSALPGDLQAARAAWRGLRFKLGRQSLRNFIRLWTKDD